MPRNPIFPKNRISGWYGNLCFPALGNVLAKVALSDSMIWPSMAVILNKGGLLIQLWLWRNPIFPKNRISGWYGNLCFPALGNVLAKVALSDSMIWPSMAVILNKGGLLIQLWLWRNPIFPKNRISWRYGNLCFPALEAIPSNDPSAQTHVWHEMQK